MPKELGGLRDKILSYTTSTSAIVHDGIRQIAETYELQSMENLQALAD